jgi:UDP-N-acetylglucosamine diphosphorylase/glucosamine-1-phosphate N-acetyltransferase
MADIIMLFEDEHCDQLLPLAYLRPVYELRCGTVTLREKIVRAYPGTPLALHCRPFLADLVRSNNPTLAVNQLKAKSCLFLNGRMLADPTLASSFPLQGADTLYVNNGSVMAARVSGSNLERLAQNFPPAFGMEQFAGLPTREISAQTISYPWDLVHHNGSQIVADFATLNRGHRGTIDEGVHLLAGDNIIIGEGARVKPGVVLDAENGPIIIGRNAKVFPNATIEGPAFVGEGSLVKIGAKIYENTSIGEMCKVGGEVEESIIHSYSNKQHDGFLGHSYLGMWVNLGADTNNSDLKNNYGIVRAVINGNEIDTGSQFVGLTMGDHSKSGINTMFNTGTVVGIMCNIFGGGYPPKSIPSFSWGGSEALTLYDIEKGIEVARRVMSRRKKALGAEEEKLLRRLFEDSGRS